MVIRTGLQVKVLVVASPAAGPELTADLGLG